jgi:hypothetical protein
MDPTEPLGHGQVAAAGLAATVAMLETIGPCSVSTTRSQVAFRRRRGFAYLWSPGRYLRCPPAELVLSIALPRRDPSPRWKQVVQTSPRVWMHHLEIHDPAAELDEEVAAWLRAAWAAAV